MRETEPLLLVESRKIDVMMVRHALKELGVRNPLVHVTNGKQALEYLKDTGQGIPSLILLDLNTPRINGMDLLRILKIDEQLKAIPVLILADFSEQQDVNKNFDLGAAGYIVKSAVHHKFIEKIKTIYSYWSLSELPNGRYR